MGGVIAFEMAQQLRAAGEGVALLALIDSYTPRALDQLGAPATRAPANLDPAVARRLDAVLQANTRALRGYQPRVYGGPVTLFGAKGAKLAVPGRGWADLAGGGLTLHEIPGDHDSIVELPHVIHLAGILAGYLSGAREGRQPPPEELK